MVVCGNRNSFDHIHIPPLEMVVGPFDTSPGKEAGDGGIGGEGSTSPRSKKECLW